MNPIRWFEIYVQDITRAKAFYESVFQVKLEKLKTPESLAASGMELWSFPSDSNTSGCGGALVKMPGVDSGAGGTLVYFGSDDCAADEKRILTAGGTIHRSKTPIGEYGFIVLANDPEGNLIGVHSLK